MVHESLVAAYEELECKPPTIVQGAWRWADEHFTDMPYKEFESKLMSDGNESIPEVEAIRLKE